jgi:hypothetical protein
MSFAQAIILACEVASKAVDGSQITLYERGPGALKERLQRAHFTYSKADIPAPTPSTAPTPNSTYANIINNHVCTPRERDEMVKDCHLALLKAQNYAQLVPDVVYNDLYAYIVKYVYR